MTDDEIRRALMNFSDVWRRVGGKKGRLPEELVLMPGKDEKISPYLK